MASFKFSIWEFLRKFPNVTTTVSETQAFGLVWIQVPDPFHDQIIRRRWHSGQNLQNVQKLSGDNLSQQWLEQTFLCPSLFSSPSILEIYQAQNLKPDVLETLASLIEQGACPGAFLTSYSQGNGSGGAKTKKNKSTVTPQIVIEPPKFWEFMKMVDFLCEEFNCQISDEVKQAIGDESGGEMDLIMALVGSLALLHPTDQAKLTAQDIKLVESGARVDKFEVAKLWGDKKWQELMHVLNLQELSAPQWRLLISFVRSHLLKFPDIWNQLAPAASNPYQRSLFEQAPKWNWTELSEEIKILSSLEIKAKSKESDWFGPLPSRALTHLSS